MSLDGIITAMATPIGENETVSVEGVNALVERLITNGIKGLFILGTNGEFFSLSDDEKVEYAKIVVEKAAGRVPVYVGTGGISTKAVINLTKKMESIGISAVSIITPFLLSFSQDELYHHYEEISKNTKLPIILYNIPQNTNNNLEPETVSKLAKFPNIIGIKDSGGDLKQLESYIELTKDDDFSVLVGSDSKILAALQLGATGAVAATSNVLTKTDVGIYDNFLSGNIEEAKRLQESIDEYRRILKFSTVTSVLKYTLKQIGIPVGTTFSPVCLNLSESEKSDIQNVLESYQTYEKF